MTTTFEDDGTTITALGRDGDKSAAAKLDHEMREGCALTVEEAKDILTALLEKKLAEED